jgi:hypothetical protein
MVCKSGFRNHDRPEKFLAVMGSINDYSERLILAAFDTDVIKQAVEHRSLYKYPEPRTHAMAKVIFSKEQLKAVGMVFGNARGATDHVLAISDVEWELRANKFEEELLIP